MVGDYFQLPDYKPLDNEIVIDIEIFNKLKLLNLQKAGINYNPYYFNWDIDGNIDNNYVIISLYVDDRTKLSDSEKFKYINKSGRIQYINNIGRRWSLFQQINFNNASQPYYVAMLPSGKILSEPIQFTSDKNFQNWLEKSIE